MHRFSPRLGHQCSISPGTHLPGKKLKLNRNSPVQICNLWVTTLTSSARRRNGYITRIRLCQVERTALPFMSALVVSTPWWGNEGIYIMFECLSHVCDLHVSLPRLCVLTNVYSKYLIYIHTHVHMHRHWKAYAFNTRRPNYIHTHLFVLTHVHASTHRHKHKHFLFCKPDDMQNCVNTFCGNIVRKKVT